MQAEVYNAAANIGSPTPANVSATAKAALNAPQTQTTLIQAKSDINALVTTKKVLILNNMHLLLGTVNRTIDGFSSSGTANGLPTSYHSFDTLQILATKLS